MGVIGDPDRQFQQTGGGRPGAGGQGAMGGERHGVSKWRHLLMGFAIKQSKKKKTWADTRGESGVERKDFFLR